MEGLGGAERVSAESSPGGVTRLPVIREIEGTLTRMESAVRRFKTPSVSLRSGIMRDSEQPPRG